MNARKVNKVPEQETRGGDKPDWDKVVVGQPLTDRPEEYPEPDSAPIVTKSGKVLTEADVQALADEAEQGYEL